MSGDDHEAPFSNDTVNVLRHEAGETAGYDTYQHNRLTEVGKEDFDQEQGSAAGRPDDPTADAAPMAEARGTALSTPRGAAASSQPRSTRGPPLMR